MLSMLQNIDIVAVLGGLAFLVNLIVQMIKDLKFIKDQPTQLVTLVVSLITTLAVSLTYLSATGVAINISVIVVSIIASFPTAFISMYGFNTFKDLYNRFRG